MEIQRTVKIKLHADASAKQVLEKTTEIYTACFNAVVRWGWDHSCDNAVTLHKATYYTLRQAHPQMKSQLLISSRVKACEALTSAFALLQKHQTQKQSQQQTATGAAIKSAPTPGKALAKPEKRPAKAGRAPTCPTSKFCPIRYDARSYTIDFVKQTVSLCTLEKKRLELTFCVPDALTQYTKNTDTKDTKEAKEAKETAWKTTSADLCRDVFGRWWLHVAVKGDVVQPPPTDQRLGVDLGIVSPAWDSDNRPYGNNHWRVVELAHKAHRQRLQAKGTKSARRRLRKIKGRQKRFRRDCDHVLSKQIVRNVDPGAVIVMEDLTDIRSRVRIRKEQRERLHGWSFAQLQRFVTYKAQSKGVWVAHVPSHYTSQTCSQCGHCERANRPSQAAFCCRKCGYCAQADFNAACNIRDKYKTHDPSKTSDKKRKGLPVNQPIVSDVALRKPRSSRYKPPTLVGGC